MDSKNPSRGPHQLPAGRHGLDRGYVVANQRTRILDATALVASSTGYDQMNVEAVIAAAGVSRRTFYDLYANKEDAFLASYEQIAHGLRTAIADACGAGQSIADRAEAALTAAMTYLAQDPAAADVYLVQARAAGAQASDRLDADMRSLAASVDGWGQTLPKRSRPPAVMGVTLVGGVAEAARLRLAAGQPQELLSLVPDMLYLLLLPYAGDTDANAARARARRRVGRL